MKRTTEAVLKSREWLIELGGVGPTKQTKGLQNKKFNKLIKMGLALIHEKDGFSHRIKLNTSFLSALKEIQRKRPALRRQADRSYKGEHPLESEFMIGKHGDRELHIASNGLYFMTMQGMLPQQCMPIQNYDLNELRPPLLVHCYKYVLKLEPKAEIHFKTESMEIWDRGIKEVCFVRNPKVEEFMAQIIFICRDEPRIMEHPKCSAIYAQEVGHGFYGVCVKEEVEHKLECKTKCSALVALLIANEALYFILHLN